MQLELKFLDLLQNLHHPGLDSLMVFITRLGDRGMIWVILTVILLLPPKTRKSGIAVAAALGIDVILCNGVFKPLFARVRPCDINLAVPLLIARPEDFSFPSGHTAAAFSAVTALYLSREKRLWKFSLALAILIAYSRMYLYVHYPTDILGGIVLGVISGFAGSAVRNRIGKGQDHSQRVKRELSEKNPGKDGRSS